MKGANTPFYKLSGIKWMAIQRRVVIRPNALQGAKDGFGWGFDDVLKAIQRLSAADFHKSAESEMKPGVMMDFYKSQKLGVYTHFYVDGVEVRLVVNSFKRI
jgi:hypothetical protein